ERNVRSGDRKNSLHLARGDAPELDLPARHDQRRSIQAKRQGTDLPPISSLPQPRHLLAAVRVPHATGAKPLTPACDLLPAGTVGQGHELALCCQALKIVAGVRQGGLDGPPLVKRSEDLTRPHVVQAYRCPGIWVFPEFAENLHRLLRRVGPT